MGIPVVIASNGRGICVRNVTSGAPVMTVATNGFGIPIVLGTKGIPFVVQGAGVVTPAPVFTVQPSISGTPQVGQTLTGSDGTITNGTVSARRWLLDGTAISGATGGTYVPVSGDVGYSITYRVFATGAGGSNVATSVAVGPVIASGGTPTPTPTPSATPPTPELADPLTGWTTGDNPPAWDTLYPPASDPLNSEYYDPDTGEGDQLRVLWRFGGTGSFTTEAWVPFDNNYLVDGFKNYAFLTDGTLDAGGLFEVKVQSGRDIGLGTQSLGGVSAVWDDVLNAAAAGLWAPTDYTGTKYAHWDASNSASITRDGSNRVTAWANLFTGTGVAFNSYTTGVDAPAYDGPNNAVKTDNGGTDGRMGVAGWPATWTMFCLCKVPDSTIYRTLLWSSANNHPLLTRVGDRELGLYNSGFVDGGVALDGNPHLLALECSGSGNYKLSVDGNTVANLTGGPSGLVVEFGGHTGQALGTLYNTVLVQPGLSTGDWDKFVASMMWAYGIQANLPIGHPYKSAAPTA